MTKLLSQAIAEAKRLPEWEQDALAAMILDEIADNHECLSTEIDKGKADLLVKLVESSLSASLA
ncbi:MAG: hypothetical protein CSA11_06190 [Chloroflexi bacterium]|nr:MAG: hypothetical protein CSB13_08755 [Chloroflexota bacterium]PIE81044.1 MAG: hypothetical protein CSA11_06190 [Chloroflexota bacterium]